MKDFQSLQSALNKMIPMPSDLPVVRRIVKKAAQNDYRLSSIVMGITESAPFQMRTKLEPVESAKAVPGPAGDAKVVRSNNPAELKIVGLKKE